MRFLFDGFRKYISIPLLVLAAFLLLTVAANHLASSLITRRLKAVAAGSDYVLIVKDLRFNVIGSRLRIDGIELSRETEQILAVAEFEVRGALLRIYRDYRRGKLDGDIDFLLHRASGAQPLRIWRQAESLQNRGLLPRKLRLIGLSRGDDSLDAVFAREAEDYRFSIEAGVGIAGQPFAVDFSGTANFHLRNLELNGRVSSPDLFNASISAQSNDVGNELELSGDWHLRVAGVRLQELLSSSAAFRDEDTGGVPGVAGVLPDFPDYVLDCSFSGEFSPGYVLPQLNPGPEDGKSQAGTQAPPRGRFLVHDTSLWINSVHLDVGADLDGLFFPRNADGERIFPGRSPVLPEGLKLKAATDGLEIQTLLSLVPPFMMGELAAARVEGKVSGDVRIQTPVNQLQDMKWLFNVDTEGFRILGIPADFDVFILNDSFIHEIRDDAVGYRRLVRIPEYRQPSMEWMLKFSEHTRGWIQRLWAEPHPEVELLPATSPDFQTGLNDSVETDPDYHYVYLEEMSPWVPSAVLTSEDGNFFFHKGVDWTTVGNAIARNIADGSIVLGASTISMQLMKILFLNQNREYSRKLQELMLVYVLEDYANIPKDRILELYLNLVEFGPGVFGIRDAADYYFAKKPSELSAGEAVWLASILPSPKRYHRYFERGAISNLWFERMKGIFEIMRLRGRMTDEEYQTAISTIPVFTGAAAGQAAVSGAELKPGSGSDSGPAPAPAGD